MSVSKLHFMVTKFEIGDFFSIFSPVNQNFKYLKHNFRLFMC